MNRWTVIVLGLAVVCLIGCGRETGTERQEADLERISEAALADAVYLDRLQGEPGEAADGQYGDPQDYVHMELLNLRAYGDLNGDGVEDAAVLLATNTGGSGVFVDLAAVCDHRGKPQDTARFFLGDRVKPERVEIVGEEIVLSLLVHGPDDPLCCPTERVTWRFRLVGDDLIKQ
jgi:hypothetical protein